MKKTTFQLVSDLHLEYFVSDKFENLFELKSKNLILAGDIGNPSKPNYKKFLQYCSENYEKTFLISGNHEYYQFNVEKLKIMDEVNSKIEKICDKYHNVYFLNNKSFQTEEYIIFGTTLWSRIKDKKYILSFMNDYNYIYSKLNERITIDETNAIFEKNLNWLEKELIKNICTGFKKTITIGEENPIFEITKNKKVIVITHHLPSYELVNEKYKDDPINEAFATNLNHLFDKVDYWCYGHTHFSNSRNIGECKFLCNPRGYEKNNIPQNCDYKKNFVFEI